MESTEREPSDRRTELLDRAYRRGYALRLQRRRRLFGAASLVVIAGLVAGAVGYANRDKNPSVSVAATSSTSSASTTTPTTAVYVGDPHVHVSLILPPGGIPSGHEVAATLVIRNDTGAPIRSIACEIPGESVLGQMGLVAQPPAPPVIEPPTQGPAAGLNKGGVSNGACEGPEHDMVGVGTTRVPFLLAATTSLCQLAPKSQLGVDPCWRDGTPLAPGRYYVSYDWYGGTLPTPTIAVQVVP